MPLWKIYTPENAYTPEDKHKRRDHRRSLRQSPDPPLLRRDDLRGNPRRFVLRGREVARQVVRLKIDHMARTLPTPAIRKWWIAAADELITPWVKDRGYDWEITIDELPADLWSLQGEVRRRSNPSARSAGSRRTRRARTA